MYYRIVLPTIKLYIKGQRGGDCVYFSTGSLFPLLLSVSKHVNDPTAKPVQRMTVYTFKMCFPSSVTAHTEEGRRQRIQTDDGSSGERSEAPAERHEDGHGGRTAGRRQQTQGSRCRSSAPRRRAALGPGAAGKRGKQTEGAGPAPAPALLALAS